MIPKTAVTIKIIFKIYMPKNYPFCFDFTIHSPAAKGGLREEAKHMRPIDIGKWKAPEKATRFMDTEKAQKAGDWQSQVVAASLISSSFSPILYGHCISRSDGMRSFKRRALYSSISGWCATNLLTRARK